MDSNELIQIARECDDLCEISDSVAIMSAAVVEKFARRVQPQWLPIETAPRDGTSILGWSESTDVLTVRWTAPIHFLTDSELDGLDEESAESEDWFCADFIAGTRLDGTETPTHWMPLPKPPEGEQ